MDRLSWNHGRKGKEFGFHSVNTLYEMAMHSALVLVLLSSCISF